MPIVLNTNSAATEATFNLSKANDNLRRSIASLSSGNRITKPTDDAGGLAVAYKLQSSVKRTEASLNNHQNALSFLQVQDGVLEAMGDIVDRMAELPGPWRQMSVRMPPMWRTIPRSSWNCRTNSLR